MNRPNRSTYRLSRSVALLALAGMPFALAPVPARAFPAPAAQQVDEDEAGILVAKKSRVAPVALPAGAFRYTGKKEIATYAEALNKLFGTKYGAMGEVEVLVWQDGAAARKELPQLLKQARYGYATREPLKLEEGRIIPFLSTRPEGDGTVLALWIEQGKSVILTWALASGQASAPAPSEDATPKLAPALQASGGQSVPTGMSRLTGLALAPGAQAAGTAEQLAGVADRLGAAARQLGVGTGVDPATVEMLGWENGGPAPRAALYSALQKKGYGRTDYPAVKNDAGTYSHFSLAGPNGTLFGMWVEAGNHLVLAWGRITGKSPEAPALAPGRGEQAASVVRQAAPAPAPDGGAISIQLQPETYYTNVMKGAMPRIPSFPALSKKPGFVRGYVYDSNGRPLKGAKLGVRSTAVGGFYSGASATTDEKGYYEISVPSGVGHFYCAGYAVEHGEGLAAMSLHPADGAMGNFATPTGEVKNWVLLPYGIADRAKLQDDPRAGGNYYGGTVVLGWSIDEGGIFSSPNYLPNQSTLEFTLTPTGPLLDGSAGRAITIRKTVSSGTPNQLYVNNIPAGPYQVTAKLVGGGPLRIRETGPYGNRPFGLEPKRAEGKAGLMLRPNSGDAGMVPGAYGSWGQISLMLERP